MEIIKGENFESRLAQTPFVIVEFGAPSCGPCKKVPPLVREVIQELSEISISAFRIDITRDMVLAQKFQVMGLPTVILFKDGIEIERFHTVPKKEKLKAAIR